MITDEHILVLEAGDRLVYDLQGDGRLCTFRGFALTCPDADTYAVVEFQAPDEGIDGLLLFTPEQLRTDFRLTELTELDAGRRA